MITEPMSESQLRESFKNRLEAAKSQGTLCYSDSGMNGSTEAAINAVAMSYPKIDESLVDSAHKAFDEQLQLRKFFETL